MAFKRAVRLQVGVLCLLLVAALARQLSCSQRRGRKGIRSDDDSRRVEGNLEKFVVSRPGYSSPGTPVNYGEHRPSQDHPNRSDDEDLPLCREPSSNGTCNFRRKCGETPHMLAAKYHSTADVHNATEGEFPSFVRVLFRDKSYCGGTLITDRHVLTAGSCLHREGRTRIPKSLILGDYKLTEKDTNEEKRSPSEICLSSKYNLTEDGPAHDWAVITLHKPVNFTDLIQPACLPFKQVTTVGDNAICFAVGMGFLRQGDKHELIQPDRLQRLQVVRVSCLGWNITDSDYSRECYMPKYDSDLGMPCSSDAGGPVICIKNVHWTLSGIISLNLPSMQCNSTAYRTGRKFLATRVRTTLEDIKIQCGI